MLKSERLILRPWREEDLEPFAKMNADVRVREYFPGLLSREQSDLSVKMFSEHIQQHGWGFWAAALIETDEFIGFIGLQNVASEAHFAPAVEVGWRLAQEFWGRGYATEGAKAALRYAFETLKLDEVVSYTVEGNWKSRNVMEKIGMQRNPEEDFDHPKILEGNPLRRHVLYRISRI